MAAPVIGPPARMSAATIRPMPKPPMRGASGDTLVPNTAHRRKIVRIPSTTIPVRSLTFAPSPGVPTCVRESAVGSKSNEYRSANPAMSAPTACAIQ